MGKSVIPKYRVEFELGGQHQVWAWSGRANFAKLDAWRKAVNASFAPGGVNFRPDDILQRVGNARIVEQASGEVVVIFKAPKFELIFDGAA